MPVEEILHFVQDDKLASLGRYLIMATLSAIARPYAHAAYEFARAEKEIRPWELMLQAAAAAIEEPELSKVLSNTCVTPQQWFSLLSEILAPHLNEKRKNFLHLLTENKRISALPAIAALFKEYEAMDNQETEIEVTTAIPLDQPYRQKLSDKLSQMLKHQVSLRCEVDGNILGGAIVRAGDKVIDGSVRGQLTRLLEFAIR